jgi:hypothetical protein
MRRSVELALELRDSEGRLRYVQEPKAWMALDWSKRLRSGVLPADGGRNRASTATLSPMLRSAVRLSAPRARAFLQAPEPGAEARWAGVLGF